MKRHGRRKPYTEIGIRRLPCARCGEPAHTQWQVCADGNLYRPVCNRCDVMLNGIVLAFFKDRQVTQKMQAYQKLRMNGA